MISTIQSLMSGAIDLHVHASYEAPPRRQNMLRESQHIQTIIDMIKKVGPEHCVLATDLGRFNYPPSVEGMRMFISALLLGGVEEKDIERMAKINPAYLLGL